MFPYFPPDVSKIKTTMKQANIASTPIYNIYIHILPNYTHCAGNRRRKQS